jgi:hypothetical protein
MDIESQTEILLRGAGFDTWAWAEGPVPAVAFESVAIAGFVHVFPTASDLLAGWADAQRVAFDRHHLALRAAGAKAWNIYSIFLAQGATAVEERAIERIDEDFSMARKIARGNVIDGDDLRMALLPLLPIQSKPVLENTHYQELLRARLKDLAPAVVDAFVGAATPGDIAHMLETD